MFLTIPRIKLPGLGLYGPPRLGTGSHLYLVSCPAWPPSLTPLCTQRPCYCSLNSPSKFLLQSPCVFSPFPWKLLTWPVPHFLRSLLRCHLLSPPPTSPPANHSLKVGPQSFSIPLPWFHTTCSTYFYLSCCQNVSSMTACVFC